MTSQRQVGVLGSDVAKIGRLAGVALLVSASVLACTPPASAKSVYCGGLKATLVVSAKSPLIVNGTPGNDVIAETGGLHEVLGGAGNDTICADSVGSTLIGGSGNDRLIGGTGTDRLLGGPGNDVLQGGAGNDDLIGMDGKDTKNGGAGSNYCDTDATDPAAADCKYDPHTPTIQSISVTTPQVDFRAGDRWVDYEIHTTDAGSSIWSVNVGLCGPDGNADGTTVTPMSLKSGTLMDGTWLGNQQLPDDAPSGTWSICSIQLLSTDANYVTYASKVMPGSNARPMPAGNTWIVANDGGDHRAPVISDITITPSVDVTSQDATVICEFTVLEIGSGLGDVDVDLRHLGPVGAAPQTHTATTFPGWLDTGNPQLITPDSRGADGSGRYRATIVLPVGSAPGWWFANIRAIDRANNQTMPYAQMRVVDSNPITDVPQLVDGQVSAGSTPGPKTIRLHLTSTRDEVSIVSVGITHPSGDGVGVNPELVTGSATDGVWQGVFDVPADETGNWSISSVSVIDRLGVVRQLLPAELAVITGRTWTTQ